jgi:hypothetical protein
MSEATTRQPATRLPERQAVEKSVVVIDDGAWFEYALSASPDEARRWLQLPETANIHVIGPWVGALEEGEPEHAVMIVRSPVELSIPIGFKLFDPQAARGLLGVFAGC